MNFSPCEKFLAVGTHDNTIKIFQVDETNYLTYATLKGHSSYILGFDWSEDSKYIRSNSGDYELFFWDVATKVQDINGATSTQSVNWATNSCKITFGTLGMFPASEDYTHINTVSLSPDRKYLVNGDDWGIVNIYNYPCPMNTKCNCISLKYPNYYRPL